MQMTLSEIPWGLVAPILILQFILIVVALIDLVRIEATNGPKWVWAIVIVLGNLIGPIIYFAVGRNAQ
ncbi:PLD nuclease N-terminal domain-containing protein [Chryseomicrobium aureum]|uniref:PLD nuclease N-terminal domain-containing protein n=1 Tax=Chryseomicrobium aureum TaxID=1441723 RepID=UPI00195A4D83|nr:PLD nuclease N-terminal domain-containing protein [Chryseomicrobium aureum]MBM7706227.1 nucleoside recognition membrane protein YjiH [Chryseomicrobium aureum]